MYTELMRQYPLRGVNPFFDATVDMSAAWMGAVFPSAMDGPDSFGILCDGMSHASKQVRDTSLAGATRVLEIGGSRN